MLPTKPQSIMSIFFNSIKPYKESFVALLPISAVLSTIHIASRILDKISDKTDQLWISGCNTLIAFFGIFCVCYGICFVYDILTKQGTNYRTVLKNNAKKILRLFIFSSILFITMTSFIVAIYFFRETITNFLPAMNSAFVTLTIAIFVLIFIPTTLCFSIVFSMEVLLKNAGILPAMKKALRISIGIKNIFRMWYLLIVAILLTLLVFIPTVVLMGLFYWICLKLSIAITAVFALAIFSIFTTMTLIWTPLQLIISIYLYNDLNLRFESNIKNQPIAPLK